MPQPLPVQKIKRKNGKTLQSIRKKKPAFASSLIPFPACLLSICENLCRQGCVSTHLDLEGINFTDTILKSGKEF